MCVCVCARARARKRVCHPFVTWLALSASILDFSPLLPPHTQSVPTLLAGVLALSVVLAEQEGENLSGLSDNPDRAIFAVRENSTTCLMVEFAVKFLVPYDVLALNGIDVRDPPVNYNACECFTKRNPALNLVFVPDFH